LKIIIKTVTMGVSNDKSEIQPINKVSFSDVVVTEPEERNSLDEGRGELNSFNVYTQQKQKIRERQFKRTCQGIIAIVAILVIFTCLIALSSRNT